jgi:hypothetical protein
MEMNSAHVNATNAISILVAETRSTSIRVVVADSELTPPPKFCNVRGDIHEWRMVRDCANEQDFGAGFHWPFTDHVVNLAGVAHVERKFGPGLALKGANRHSPQSFPFGSSS